MQFRNRAGPWIAGCITLILLLLLWLLRDWRNELPDSWRTDKVVPLNDFVKGGVWLGLAAAAAVAGLLLLVSPWWGRRWPASLTDTAAELPRWFWPVVVIIMLSGAALRAPRLGLSLYNDEAYSVRRHLVGMIPVREMGNPEKFRQAEWLETIYDNRVANNSVLFSALSRASHDFWVRFSGAAPGVISETALRMPVFVCGVLSIGALGLLGGRLGGARLGVLATLLAALHPWHMRYSGEARCYGILMLLIPLMFLALDRALRTGRWSAWLLFGLTEYLSVLCFMGMVHVLLALNGFIAGTALLSFLRKRPGAFSAAVPAAVVGLAAASLFLAAHLPLVLQAARAMDMPFYPHGPITAAWFLDSAAFLGFGVSAADGIPGDPLHLCFARWWSAHPAASGMAAVFATALILAGLLKLGRKKGSGPVLVAASAGGIAFTLLYSVAKGIRLMPWYGVFLVPGIVMFAAAGVDRLAACFKNRRTTAATTAALLVAAFWPWPDVLRTYTARSREQLRGVVELVRQTPYPASLGNPANTLVGVMWSEISVYDPSSITIRSEAELEQLIETARAEHRPLYVEFAFRGKMQATYPEILRRLEEGREFERSAILTGTDDDNSTHCVFRLVQKQAGTS